MEQKDLAKAERWSREAAEIELAANKDSGMLYKAHKLWNKASVAMFKYARKHPENKRAHSYATHYQKQSQCCYNEINRNDAIALDDDET